ncbi:MAG: proton-translocating NADH-quinone oxidoreductase, chain [Bacteroidetes bacterium]|jgi:NADH-quinone oxidoreductase subunit N|nr:proton-translocating NADH-quinone oxidoreductase, chain [Bacteroidota bacterium]MDF2452859.1 proton-translocating NADH-quinone oxidoreductase, chain [Bacteroidota bacterium]
MKGLFIISGLGVLAMLAEIFKFKKLLYPLVLIGILAAYATNFMEWNNNLNIPMFSNMIRFDNVALAFSGVILVTAFFWFILANDYFEQDHVTDHFALVLFALVGAIMLTAFSNMTTLFLGIEILSIPMYVLAASRKRDLASNEAGFKYLIMGSFASGFLLFGIALIYGATGSFDLMAIRSFISHAQGSLPVFFYAGVLMVLVAMLFKVSAAPFHFWAPDVYEGSPTVITALMSTIVKTAAFAAFMHLFLVVFGGVSQTWSMVLAVVIALSLVVSNITAATQESVKRMLAYSSISHAAFMLMAILANNRGWASINAILYYSLAYSIGSILAFTVLYNVSKSRNSSNIEAFNGLGKRHPFMAACMVIAMLSLAGIPVTAGFFAKYFVFSVMIGTSFKWLIILAILTSAVGVYYYFKVIIAMYFKKDDSQEDVVMETSHVLLLAITALFTIVLGLIPNYVIEIFT